VKDLGGIRRTILSRIATSTVPSSSAAQTWFIRGVSIGAAEVTLASVSKYSAVAKGPNGSALPVMNDRPSGSAAEHEPPDAPAAEI